MDWLLVLGLEEGLVECATLCGKSWVNCVALFIIVPFNWLNLLGHSGCP